MSDTATSISPEPEPVDGCPDEHVVVHVVGLDHVQLAMPVGGEANARRFYAGTLGLTEVAKPAALAVRGGCWFESAAVKVHLGAEADFRPARKAHPALLVVDLDGLLRSVMATWPVQAVWSDEIPGTRRCHIDDPFGNRIELIEAHAAQVGA